MKYIVMYALVLLAVGTLQASNNSAPQDPDVRRFSHLTSEQILSIKTFWHLIDNRPDYDKERMDYTSGLDDSWCKDMREAKKNQRVTCRDMLVRFNASIKQKKEKHFATTSVRSFDPTNSDQSATEEQGSKAIDLVVVGGKDRKKGIQIICPEPLV